MGKEVNRPFNEFIDSRDLYLELLHNRFKKTADHIKAKALLYRDYLSTFTNEDDAVSDAASFLEAFVFLNNHNVALKDQDIVIDEKIEGLFFTNFPA